MIEMLLEHPAESIPVILSRIILLQNDYYLKTKKDKINTWRSECAKHWHKSLDHMCVRFKINEKKTQVNKEFLNKMKSLMDEFKIQKDLNIQKQLLSFYTGFEGQEIKSLNLELDPSISPDHPMLLNDVGYSENFEKLPQFRFLINDEEVLKLVIKMLYFCTRNYNEPEIKRKFLISFSKLFLCLGFIKENMKSEFQGKLSLSNFSRLAK